MPRYGNLEAEWRTRKSRIDPKLDALGWRIRAEKPGGPFRSEEFETDAGPADYTPHIGGHVVGIIEAKKLTVGPQNVLTQAERYARGIRESPYNFDGRRVPFLYSTNGEIVWFHDVRGPLSPRGGWRTSTRRRLFGRCSITIPMPPWSDSWRPRTLTRDFVLTSARPTRPSSGRWLNVTAGSLSRWPRERGRMAG